MMKHGNDSDKVLFNYVRSFSSSTIRQALIKEVKRKRMNERLYDWGHDMFVDSMSKR